MVKLRKRHRSDQSKTRTSDDQSASCESDIGDEHEYSGTVTPKNSKKTFTSEEEEQLPPLYEEPSPAVKSQKTAQCSQDADPQHSLTPENCPKDDDTIPSLYDSTRPTADETSVSSPGKVNDKENGSDSNASQDAQADGCKRSRKRKISMSSGDTVMDIFEKTITVCIDNDDSQDNESFSSQTPKKCKTGKKAILESLLDAVEISPEKSSGSCDINNETFPQKARSVSVIDFSGSDHCHGDGPKSTLTLGQSKTAVYKNMVDIVSDSEGEPIHQSRSASLLQTPDEAAVAAARLITDMSGVRSSTSLPNVAETHVTNSGYGYCSSGDTQFAQRATQYPVNMASQTIWQSNIYGQPEQYGQWEGNMVAFDGNNNMLNRGGYHQVSAQYPGAGVPMRVVSNGVLSGMPECYDDDAQMPPDYRNIHPYPMGIPLDYSKENSDIEGHDDPTGKQVRKFVIIDPKSANGENGSSAKRSQRTKSNEPTELVADYEEIVKNLFVNAPPQKTVLVQPRFLSKYRGPGGNDIDTTKVKSISHRGLIKKYIDYLIMENEYITEISKAVSLPMDNCVMDDPYLMDVIRIKIPFPTPKYMQFLKDFYPAIQVDWRALNHQLDQYRSSGDGSRRFQSYYIDNRAVPVLLGEAFYFFQRESDRKSMETCQQGNST